MVILASWNTKDEFCRSVLILFTLVSKSEWTFIPFLRAQSLFWLEDFPTAKENNGVSQRNKIHERTTKIYKKMKNSASSESRNLTITYSRKYETKTQVHTQPHLLEIFKYSLKMEQRERKSINNTNGLPCHILKQFVG